MSTDGSSRHSDASSDGCQPPQTIGIEGFAAFTALPTASASWIGAPVSTVMPTQTRFARCGDDRADRILLEPAVDDDDVDPIAIERRGDRDERQRHRKEHRARVVEDDAGPVHHDGSSQKVHHDGSARRFCNCRRVSARAERL